MEFKDVEVAEGKASGFDTQDIDFSLANYLEDEGYLQESTNMFSWPFPNERCADHQFYQLSEHSKVDTTYTAVGRQRPFIEQFNEEHEDITSLDALETSDNMSKELQKILEGPVTSHHVAEMARNDTLKEIADNGIGTEYARDIAMAPMYSEEVNPYEAWQQADDPEAHLHYTDENRNAFEAIAQDSADIVRDGVTIVDIHDYTMSGLNTDLGIEHEFYENDLSFGVANLKHLEVVSEAYETAFNQVKPLVVSNEQNTEDAMANGRAYLIAENP